MTIIQSQATTCKLLHKISNTSTTFCCELLPTGHKVGVFSRRGMSQMVHANKSATPSFMRQIIRITRTKQSRSGGRYCRYACYSNRLPPPFATSTRPRPLNMDVHTWHPFGFVVTLTSSGQLSANPRSIMPAGHFISYNSVMDGEFIAHEGAVFKRKPEGGYQAVVYCPGCGQAASSLDDVLCFYCPRCNWRSNFTGQQLPAVMKSLPDAGEDD